MIIVVTITAPTNAPAANAHQSNAVRVLFNRSSLCSRMRFSRLAFTSLSRSVLWAYATHMRSKLSQLLSITRVGGLPSAFCFTLAFTFARPLAAV